MLHERIKSSTAEDHKNAERHSYGKEIMDRSLTKTQYAQLLTANYRYIAPWEKQWDLQLEIDTTALQLEQRTKTTLLENDLKALGIDPESINTSSLEAPSTLAQFLGRMYVIEGSTLGGAMIEKQLKLNPHLSGCSFDFYGGYGQNLIPFWKSFLAQLNTVEHPQEQDEAIEWARRCFKEMESCFINAKSLNLDS
ncbi:MAG: biliverdin-producing heme oxygenase [Bacteroidetes bacterium]|jgi:heme oxygenase|nr:biliverdin-producing heme oxygenase [Bacteroidota bacterium]